MKPAVLIILDGWGIAPASPGNAVALAKKPNFDRYWNTCLHTQLEASGEAVGLPKGEDGNSETGHLNLGAGQIIFQDLPRISLAIADGSFFQIPAFGKVIDHVRKNDSSLHLMGLVGAGGVHSSNEHFLALLRLAKEEGVASVWLHLFTDGRDSPPNSSLTYLSHIEEEAGKIGIGKIATLCGRYYAMDRDFRWERTKIAYELLVQGVGEVYDNFQKAINQSYEKGISDEFLKPVVLDKKGIIKDNDGVIFFNFRIDRPRQLTKALILPDFESLRIKKSFDPYAEKYGLHQYYLPRPSITTFQRGKIIKNLFLVTMTEYEKGLPVAVAFPPSQVKMPFARVLAERGLRQLHLAETEKERFVTYYFDGFRENPFPGEDRLEIPSPKVDTYDQKPEMSAYKVTEELQKSLKGETYNFVVVNYANPDMVGHTGVISAGIKACEVVDDCLGKVVSLATALGKICVITADHGNVEEMINLQTGQVDTEHSTNPVPLIIVDKRMNSWGRILPSGILADVAPTILDLVDLPKPQTMSGKSLLR